MIPLGSFFQEPAADGWNLRASLRCLQASRWIPAARLARKPLLAGFLLCGVVSLSLAASDDPGGYSRKRSWHESLLASLEAVSRSGLEDGFAPFESETMRGGEAARKISVP